VIELLEELHGHAPLEGAIVRENGIGAAAQNAPAAASFRRAKLPGGVATTHINMSGYFTTRLLHNHNLKQYSEGYK
jgi:hypothetical protein